MCKKKKKRLKVWDADVDNIVVSKLIETKNNSKYFIGYLDDFMRTLVLILHKMSRYVKTFKNKNIFEYR